jgi:hypothetical protein
MILLVILVIIGLFVWVCVECVNLFELGTPPKDSDILEMLEKYSVDYELDMKYNDKFKLKKASFKSNAPNIHQTQYSILFPYYIDGVGLIPIWYKSTKIIEQLFKDKIVNSRYKTTTREKLGL